MMKLQANQTPEGKPWKGIRFTESDVSERAEKLSWALVLVERLLSFLQVRCIFRFVG